MAVNIDVSLIPESDVRLLCQTILEAVKKYYADPQNLKHYEEWKKERELNKNKEA